MEARHKSWLEDLAGELSTRTAKLAEGAAGAALTLAPPVLEARPVQGCRVTVVTDTACVSGKLRVPVRGAWPPCSAPRAGSTPKYPVDVTRWGICVCSTSAYGACRDPAAGSAPI